MIAGGVTTLTGALLAGGDGDAVALVDGADALTYHQLRARVADRRAELDLGQRDIVVLATTNTLEFVVTYLALLDGGHVPLLVGSHVERLTAAWRPAAVVTTSAVGIEIERCAGAARPLHPDLRLLLSTSGSTGAPKLVRLSDRNLVSNASAITEYLGLGAGDCGITSLPLHYCYGLSVLHSHLAAGARIVLTEASVVDPCFAAAMTAHGVTNVAGVPHTFDLLERAGPDRLRVPSLRFVTVAGGRLAASRVEEWAHRCAAWDAEFFVMYGQTEATARMAYLPPALALRRPGAIGVPIPGGSLELRPVDGAPDGVGELVYRGDNVMMGYATGDADLAAGAVVEELVTGDLGRFHDDNGVFEVVGRRSRFVKPFGLRIDLDVVEAELATTFGELAVTGDDERVIVCAPGANVAMVAAAVAALTGLPDGAIVVEVDQAVPRTDAGKVDHAALRHRIESASPAGGTSAGATAGVPVAAVFAAVLGCRRVAATDTFVSLGGDSLNYVECSLHLERGVGTLPPDWHLRPVGELQSLAPAARRRTSRIDTTIVLRAVGICAIVATHMHLHFFPGGAHLLLAVVGYNLSRFQLPIVETAARLRAGLRTVARTAVPTMMWVGAGMVLAGSYGAGTLLLVNNYVGPASHRGDHWHFWFIEVFVHLCLLTTIVLAVPAVRRVERRFPYGVPLALVLAALVARMEWAHLGDWYNLRFRTHGVAWFFFLGWLVHRSTSTHTKLLTTAICLATVPGFFGLAQREWFILAGLLLLLWMPQVPWPRLALRPVTAIAAASMWILITHFSVWPVLDDHFDRRVAYVLTIATGVAAAAAVAAAARLLRSLPVGRAAAAPRLATHGV